MDSVFLLDAARGAHLVGLAAGFGLALCADILALKFVFHPIAQRDVWLMRLMHRVIMVGLVVLWGSGLCILYARTGLDPAQFSAKLIAKLMVVSLLTLNALIIGAYALPCFARQVDLSFGEFDPPTLLKLSGIAGVSLSCWTSALALGVFSQLKPMPFGDLLGVFVPLFYVGFAVAMLVGVFAAMFARSGAVFIRRPQSATS